MSAGAWGWTEVDAANRDRLGEGFAVAGVASAIRVPLGPINGGTEAFGCTVITRTRMASDITSPHGNLRFSGTAAWRYRTAGSDSLIESITGATGSLGSSRTTARIVATALVGKFRKCVRESASRPETDRRFIAEIAAKPMKTA
jgi:hypothetical protein